jgi:hypothetical protein
MTPGLFPFSLLLFLPTNKRLFHIDVTFEMRTVLNGICLFIDNSKFRNIFISNGDGGEESRIAERQRYRVCERQYKGKRRDSVGHKMSH